MGKRFQNEENPMRCHNCGENLKKIITNLPFKTSRDSIVIIKQMPVLQCPNCSEYVLEDSVVRKVDALLDKIDKTAELEILKFAV
jgi:YgiT-type zinc finger domain-containing protein